MSKVLILYTSKYGSTEHYASLIRDELSADNDVTISTLKGNRAKARDYDYVIYGGGIKSYDIYNIDKFMKAIRKIDKAKTHVIIYAVGMMSGNVEYAKRLIELNEIDTSFIKFYYLRGAIDLKKLKGFDASIIKHLVSALMLRTDLTEEEKAFVGACLNSKDWTCRENILPIVEQIR